MALARPIVTILATIAIGAQTSTPIHAACDVHRLQSSEFFGTVLFPESRFGVDSDSAMKLKTLLNAALSSGYQKMLLVGYSDEPGSEQANLELSMKRASGAIAALSPVPLSISLEPLSCGETLLIAPSNGRSNAHNRRVELRAER